MIVALCQEITKNLRAAITLTGDGSENSEAHHKKMLQMGMTQKKLINDLCQTPSRSFMECAEKARVAIETDSDTLAFSMAHDLVMLTKQ